MAQVKNELTDAVYQMGERLAVQVQRMEARIHEQTNQIHTQTRWLIGLLVGLGVALVVAILINPYLG